MESKGNTLTEATSSSPLVESQWELISGFVHEFRTKLTSIIGFLEMTLDEEAGPLSEQQTRFLATARSSAGEINRLVDELSDIARIESGRLSLSLQPVNLTEQASSAVNGLKQSLDGKQQAIEWQIDQPLSPVTADERRLGQVLSSLLAYANRTLPVGATIVIALRKDTEHIAVSIGEFPGIASSGGTETEHRIVNSGELSLWLANAVIELHGGYCEFHLSGGPLHLGFALPATSLSDAIGETA